MGSAQFYSDISSFNPSFQKPKRVKKGNLETTAHKALLSSLIKSSSKEKSRIYYEFFLKDIGDPIISTAISPCPTLVGISKNRPIIEFWNLFTKNTFKFEGTRI